MADLLLDGFIWTPFCPDPDHAIFKPPYTFPQPWLICFQMASFGYLSVQIRITLFSSPDTPSQSHGRFASRWLHLDTFLAISGSSRFGVQIHLPGTMADLLPDCFIWTPFLPDLVQAILEPRYTFPEPWQICCQIASFGHLSSQIWIKPFLSPDTPSQSHGRFASRLLHLDTFLAMSGSIKG